MNAILVHRRGSLEGRKDKLQKDVIRLGRKPDNHIIFSEKAVSSYHAEIRRTGDGYALVDLDSTNGTFVNGNRIQKAALRDRDQVELGEDGPIFEFRAEAEESRGPSIVPISGSWEEGDGAIELKPGKLTLGRGLKNDIVLGREQGSVVSTEHAELRVHSAYCEIEDLGSTNGTFVNGERVRATQLQHGDRVELGEGGPVFELQWKDGRRKSRSGRSSESDRMFRKLERAAKGGPAGDRTMLMLQAAHRYYKRRRWPLLVLISVVLVVAAIAGVNWYRERARNEELIALAKDLFYGIRSQQAEMVRLQASLSEADRRSLADQISKREKQYDEYLEKLGLYEGKTETQKTIMRLARRLGETQLEVPPDFYDTVLRYVGYWKSTPRLRNALDRARQRQLIPRIRLALSQHGLPKEFALLALQESNFDATVVGPQTSFGIAKGMWQFIPGTGREYGLKIGPLKDKRQYDALDERHDENRATKAAADYLAFLYSSKAAASGMLAIASYNYGQTRIIKKLDELPLDPRQRNFWNFYRNGWLPEETKKYVMYIFSAALICEKPHLFDIAMEPCMP